MTRGGHIGNVAFRKRQEHYQTSPKSRHVILSLTECVATSAVLVILLTGCATVDPDPEVPSSVVQPLAYYPGEVKGFQKTFPEEHVLVLLPTDQRPPSHFQGADGSEAASAGASAQIGVIGDQNGTILKRIYASPIEPIIQMALVKAAKEAGLVPTGFNGALDAALHRTDQDYVLATDITACWVVKYRLPDPSWGEMWVTQAKVALQVQIYKPPFRTAFWQGERSVDYSDPPYGGLALPLDPAAMFDNPGQVLSVALTRAVAGVFSSQDLLQLIEQDLHRIGGAPRVGGKPVTRSAAAGDGEKGQVNYGGAR